MDYGDDDDIITWMRQLRKEFNQFRSSERGQPATATVSATFSFQIFYYFMIYYTALFICLNIGCTYQ